MVLVKLVVEVVGLYPGVAGVRLVPFLLYLLRLEVDSLLFLVPVTPLGPRHISGGSVHFEKVAGKHASAAGKKMKVSG